MSQPVNLRVCFTVLSHHRICHEVELIPRREPHTSSPRKRTRSVQECSRFLHILTTICSRDWKLLGRRLVAPMIYMHRAKGSAGKQRTQLNPRLRRGDLRRHARHGVDALAKTNKFASKEKSRWEPLTPANKLGFGACRHWFFYTISRETDLNLWFW